MQVSGISFSPHFHSRFHSLIMLKWVCVRVLFLRLLRGRRAGGFSRGSPSKSWKHGRRGTDGDGGPAV